MVGCWFLVLASGRALSDSGCAPTPRCTGLRAARCRIASALPFRVRLEAGELGSVSALMQSDPESAPTWFRVIAVAVALECLYTSVRVGLDLHVVQMPGMAGQPTLALAMQLSFAAWLGLSIACVVFVPRTSASRLVFAILLIVVGLAAWVSHRAIAHLVTMATYSPHSGPTWW